MEKWDLYDRHRIKTGKSITRGDRMATDEYHLVIHVCIINSNNQLLIQQRQPFKQGWSNLWDITVGGSAHKGETSQIAAQRELMEEIGLQMDLSETRPRFTLNFSRGFDDFYVIQADPKLSSLTLQESEVKQVRWASKEEILEMIQSNIFIPYHRSVIEMIFEMKDRGGAIGR